MKRQILVVLVAGLAALSVGQFANAAIVYVDADLTNTTIDSAAIVVDDNVPPGNVTSSRTNTDNLWAFDTNPAFLTNGDSVFASHNNEDSGTLETVVGGLDMGVYNVWAFYWTTDNLDNPTGNTSEIFDWDISASLNGNPPIEATGLNTNGMLAASLNYATDPSFQGGNRDLAAVYLGSVSGTGFTVTVDDLIRDIGDDRTWYDGVGYELIPEPSAFALILVGAAVLPSKRRSC